MKAIDNNLKLKLSRIGSSTLIRLGREVQVMENVHHIVPLM
jgi:hypothetical protein